MQPTVELAFVQSVVICFDGDFCHPVLRKIVSRPKRFLSVRFLTPHVINQHKSFQINYNLSYDNQFFLDEELLKEANNTLYSTIITRRTSLVCLKRNKKKTVSYGILNICDLLQNKFSSRNKNQSAKLIRKLCSNGSYFKFGTILMHTYQSPARVSHSTDGTSSFT